MPLGRALLVLLLAGCSCDPPPPAPTPAPRTEEPEAPPPSAPLPSTSRSDLGPVTPMVTIEVTNDELHVSNGALIATWPAQDREALSRAQPLGDARWPEVDETVRAHGDDIAMPTLREAFAHAANVDHARAALSGTTGTPIVFAVRAAPDVRFVRILQAIYAAGLAGYAEPRLVLMAETAEVALPLPLPRTQTAHTDDVARDLGRALASVGLEGRTRPETGLLPVVDAADGAVIAVVLASDGIHVARDGHPLGAGCAAPSDGDGVAIPTAELAPSRLTACLDAAGDASTLTFRTAPDTRYADAVAVLETLAARGPVGLAVAR